jgi:hypothetical protein
MATVSPVTAQAATAGSATGRTSAARRLRPGSASLPIFTKTLPSCRLNEPVL